MFQTSDGSVRRLTFAEQSQGFGCVRFGIQPDDSRLMPWADACKFAGTTFTARRKMEATGRRAGGNPAHWFASGEDIPLIGLRFQVWLDRWHDADVAEMVAAWVKRRSA